MPALVDLVGKPYGRLTVVRQVKERGPRGEVYWLCRCECGGECTPTTRSLTTGHTTSCGCRQRETGGKRTIDLTGQAFGHLEVIERAGSATDGKAMWRCRCLHPGTDGEPCGREKVIRGKDIREGKTQSCGHHGVGWFAKEKPVFPPRVQEAGEWWVLPTRAARIWKLHRRKAQDRAHADGIRKRPIVVGANQPVDYWAEEDVIRSKHLHTLATYPVVQGHTPLVAVCKRLKKSCSRVREVAREKGWTLPTHRAKSKDGRIGRRTYIPDGLVAELEAYFATSRQRQLAGLGMLPFDEPAVTERCHPPRSAEKRTDGARVPLPRPDVGDVGLNAETREWIGGLFGQPVPPSANGRKRKGGRPTSERTQAMYKVCYDGQRDGLYRAQVLVRIQKEFPDIAPKSDDDSVVRTYAIRYAKKHGKPVDFPAENRG